jgi:sulfotransferase family protein
LEVLKQFIAKNNNIHLPDGRPDIFLFSSPRSGSTWLLELILTQPGYKPSDEPFNLRVSAINKHLLSKGINDWHGLYNKKNTQIIEDYLQGIRQGAIGITNPFFYKNHNRIITRSVIFKILHACEDRANQISDSMNAKKIYLIRHPIPVSLSRKQLPRLNAFIESDFKTQLTTEQFQYSTEIINSGTDLQKNMLDWCIQNSVILNQINDDWSLITYEQLVLDPEPVIKNLTANLNLPYPKLIRKQLKIASNSTHQSDKTTQGVLENRESEQSKNWLVNKWKDKISTEDEEAIMSMLNIFNIDVYKKGDALPDKKYWIS